MPGDLILQLGFLESGVSLVTLIGGVIIIATAALGAITVLASHKANQVRKDLTNAIDSNKNEIGGKLDSLAGSIDRQAQAQTENGKAIVGVATELKNHLIHYAGEMAAIKTTVEAIKLDTTNTEKISQAGEIRRKAHIINIKQPHFKRKNKKKK